MTGEIPKYIEMFNGYREVYKAKEDHVLDSFSILSAIALGNEKLGDISSYMNIERTKLTRPISVLEELDIIERCVPITAERSEKCKKGLYKIKDPYFRFWFRFI